MASPSIKVSILEFDGVEYDYATEYDLAGALAHIGFTQTGVDLDRILCNEKFDALFDQNGNVIWGL